MSILKGDKKMAATLILKKMKGSSTDSEMKKSNDEFVTKPQSEHGEYDADLGLKAAAEEILSAVESRNTGSLRSALSSFMEMAREEAHDSHEASESSESE